jgi:hypothetical protein
MVHQNSAGPVAAADGTRKIVATGERHQSSTSNSANTQQLNRAELIGSDQCTAAGITLQSPSPVLAMCRALLDAGHDPTARLECYRGTTLCLTVRSIGEAAALELNSKGTGFKRAARRCAQPPIASFDASAEETRVMSERRQSK